MTLQYSRNNALWLNVNASKSVCFNDIIHKFGAHGGKIERQNLDKGIIESKWKNKRGKSDITIQTKFTQTSEERCYIEFSYHCGEKFDVSGKSEHFTQQVITELFFQPSEHSNHRNEMPPAANAPFEGALSFENTHQRNYQHYIIMAAAACVSALITLFMI